MTEKSIVVACPPLRYSFIATSPGVRDHPRAAMAPSLPSLFLPPAQSARGWSADLLSKLAILSRQFPSIRVIKTQILSTKEFFVVMTRTGAYQAASRLTAALEDLLQPGNAISAAL
jgi:hypothetical protein